MPSSSVPPSARCGVLEDPSSGRNPHQTRSCSPDRVSTSAGSGRQPPWLLSKLGEESRGSPRSVPASAPVRDLNVMSSPEDFRFGKEIGKGSWSEVLPEVVEAESLATSQVYAVKILSKSMLVAQKKVKSATIERDALLLLGSGGHPGFIRFYSAFQDSTSLYLVLELAPNGDLRQLVKKYGSLSLCGARYFTAQIVDAVQWMHSKGVLHRDLKPENILLDSTMRARVTDFGTAYIARNLDLSPRTSTFVGSAAYVCPELLNRDWKSTSKSSDLWAVGCILYFIITGVPPFMAANDYLSFRRIEALDYTFPNDFYPDAKDLVQRLLKLQVLEPSHRLGSDPRSSPSELRAHKFFAGNAEEAQPTSRIDWDTLWTDPAPTVDSGLVRPPPPVESEDEQAQERFWDDFVHGFSSVGLGGGHKADTSPDSRELGGEHVQ
ncbi:kinase-like protein [Leucogyrophana mollusca]|uniref:Kinase-like protein n=1 Tax=Leucogyrophana mollusca TaxID=85980 RepID=A0ACB8B6Q5_9AGAM|nr:kinase-like protein [Leucogyrophana mollusca]